MRLEEAARRYIHSERTGIFTIKLIERAESTSIGARRLHRRCFHPSVLNPPRTDSVPHPRIPATSGFPVAPHPQLHLSTNTDEEETSWLPRVAILVLDPEKVNRGLVVRTMQSQWGSFTPRSETAAPAIQKRGNRRHIEDKELRSKHCYLAPNVTAFYHIILLSIQ